MKGCAPERRFDTTIRKKKQEGGENEKNEKAKDYGSVRYCALIRRGSISGKCTGDE